MGELYQREGSGADQQQEGHPAQAGANQTGGQLTIDEAIRLTACFDEEWFRSFETLDADLSRFAAAFQLSPEETRQVRRVVEALHEAEIEKGSEPEAPPPNARSYGSPDRSATAA